MCELEEHLNTQLKFVDFDIVEAAFEHDWHKFNDLSKQICDLSIPDMMSLSMSISEICLYRVKKLMKAQSICDLTQTMEQDILEMYKQLARSRMDVLDPNSPYWSQAAVLCVQIHSELLRKWLKSACHHSPTNANDEAAYRGE